MPPVSYIVNGLEQPLGGFMSDEEREDFLALESLDLNALNGFSSETVADNVIRRTF